MSKKISTIAELEHEQKKLRMGLKITKDAFAKSLSSNRKEIKTYLVKRVAIPAGIAGAGLLAFNKFSKDDSPRKVKKTSSIFDDLLPLLVDVAQTFFLQKQNEGLNKIKNDQSEESTSDSHYRSPLKSVS